MKTSAEKIVDGLLDEGPSAPVPVAQLDFIRSEVHYSTEQDLHPETLSRVQAEVFASVAETLKRERGIDITQYGHLAKRITIPNFKFDMPPRHLPSFKTHVAGPGPRPRT